MYGVLAEYFALSDWNVHLWVILCRFCFVNCAAVLVYTCSGNYKFGYLCENGKLIAQDYVLWILECVDALLNT